MAQDNRHRPLSVNTDSDLPLNDEMPPPYTVEIPPQSEEMTEVREVVPQDGSHHHHPDAAVNNNSSGPEHNKEATDVSEASLPKLRFLALGISLGLGLFLAMLDTSIVSTSLFSISSSFPSSLSLINWVALSYSLSFLSFSVLFARISDVIGRKAAFLTAYAIFIAFSLGCGWSKSLEGLIACRALQGVGGAGLYSVGLVVFPEVATREQRRVIAGFVGVVVAVAGVLGPVLGGVLTEGVGWRWVFWINGPLGGVSALVFLLMWPDKRYLPVMERRKWKEVDFFGSFLLIASAALIVFPFQNSGLSHNSWSKPIFLAPLLLGIASLAGLFAWQYHIDHHRNRHRIAAALPLSLLRNHVYSAAVLTTICTGFPYLLVVYAFPIRFQVVNGKTPLEAGVMMLPILGGSAVGSALGGSFNGTKNRLFETLAVACLMMIVGCAAETTLSSSEEYEAKALGLLVFVGVGFGMAAAAATMLGHMESTIREHATAQGIIAQVRILGGSIGIAASSAVLGAKTSSQLVGVLAPEQLGHLAGAMAGLTPTQKEAVRHTYTEALQQDMVICCAVVALGLAFSMGVYSRKRLNISEIEEKQIREESDRRRREEEEGGARGDGV